ncbi:hypothetical protein QQ045_005449 [Rhodiola kirilowii]
MLSHWNKNSFGDVRAKLIKTRDEWERMATWRSKKNSISSIMVEDSWVDKPELIKKAACEYFAGIFRSPEPCQWFLEELSFGYLNNDQRLFLESDITEEEILSVIKECDGNKAPGPDGFNINFYKKFWDTFSMWYSTSASLSILINGSPTKDVSMERGLRQGDPLSPFLFLLAAEGLSRIMNNAVQKGRISGVEWGKNGAALSHLQFANDTVLFCRPDTQEVRKIKHILNTFAVCSDLEINYSKSRCLGIGIEDVEVQKFAAILGCPVGNFPLTYLGMQVGTNPGRINTWSPILQKFKQKLASWRSPNLSMAGRVWSKVTKPKKYGGLGIHWLVDMNLALLAKWWWKLVIGKGGLWRKMVLEKYDIRRPHAPNEASIHPKKLSKSWNDILNIVQGNSEVALAFKEGLKFKLGNGNSTSFWHDVWLGDIPIKGQYPKLFLLAVDKKASVREMGCWVGGVWFWQLKFRRFLYQWEEVGKKELEESLNHIQLKDQKDDKIVWSFLADESLPTKLALWKRNAIRREEDLVCLLCNLEQESVDHLLLHCPWSWKLWAICISWWGASWVIPGSAKCLLESWLIAGASKSYKRVWKTLGYVILWSIWEERNKRCFQGKKRPVEEIGELVKMRLAWWANYRSSKCPYSTSTISRCIEEVRDSF